MIGPSPVTEVLSLRQAMDQLLNESFVGSPFRTLWSRPGTGSTGGSPAFALPLNVYATQDEAVIVAAVPGLKPEDLNVAFHDGILVLSGEIGSVTEGEEAKGATWYLRELWTGRFQRAVNLPFPVDADKAEATWEHGVVRIVLPKAEQAKPRTIPIKTGGTAQAIGAGTGNQK